MACAMHAEVAAMGAARAAAAAQLAAVGPMNAGSVATLIGMGAGYIQTCCQNFDNLRQAIVTYQNSANVAPGMTPQRLAQLARYRASPGLANRVAQLQFLIAACQAIGAGAYPGLGGPWF